MILYHGSNVVVNNPEIIKDERGRDFGFGFYLTKIQAQAERMAKRKQKLTRSTKAFVSVFEWDEEKDNLNYYEFKHPNLEWLNFIINCRSNVKFRHDFDIVEGKIADDNVGETILFVIDGIIKKEEAVERLKFQEINSQIAFCSLKAIKKLKFIRSYEVK